MIASLLTFSLLPPFRPDKTESACLLFGREEGIPTKQVNKQTKKKTSRNVVAVPFFLCPSRNSFLYSLAPVKGPVPLCTPNTVRPGFFSQELFQIDRKNKR
jgi:hypothetical protein